MSLLKSQQIKPSEAAAELLRRRKARESLSDFTLYTMPDYQMNWHHKALCENLDKLLNGEIRRLMVFMPPRHGKSELVSRRLPAYALGRNPNLTLIACSYSADLSSRMNRDVQRVIDSAEYARLFPDTSLYGKNSRTASNGSFLRNSDIFEIVGHQGVYRSAGVGGGITGMGFDIGIIDDPFKDRAEGDSATIRESVWEWYTSTFYTRQAKDAAILLTMTRWHEGDLAGRLLKLAAQDSQADQWTVIRFPAVLDESPESNDPRAEGDALWPDHFNLEFFNSVKAQDSREWDALYQQRPSAREGAFFRIGQIEVIPAAPTNLKTVRAWDLAASSKGDFTAGVKIGKDDDGLFYILDVTRGQWLPDERNKTMLQTAALDGQQAKIRLAQDPGQAGVDQVQTLTRLLAGYSVKSERVSGSKETRADAFAAQVNAGNVKMVQGDWNKPFLEELRTFPLGKNDDQVDAAADAFNELANQREFSQGVWFR